jgi:hypothetical protein
VGCPRGRAPGDVVLVALVPLTWGLAGVAFGVGLPFGGPVLMAVSLGLLLVGLIGLAIGVRLVQNTLRDEP